MNAGSVACAFAWPSVSRFFHQKVVDGNFGGARCGVYQETFLQSDDNHLGRYSSFSVILCKPGDLAEKSYLCVGRC
jgi:hypothetical protein